MRKINSLMGFFDYWTVQRPGKNCSGDIAGFVRCAIFICSRSVLFKVDQGVDEMSVFISVNGSN